MYSKNFSHEGFAAFEAIVAKLAILFAIEGISSIATFEAIVEKWQKR
jgi:hypothetical protein